MNIFSRFGAGKKIIFACVISGAAAAAAGWIFFWLFESVSGDRAVRDAIIARTRAVLGEREAARTGAQILENRAADISRIRNFFVNRRDPVSFVDVLERTVRATGSTIALAVDEEAGAGLVFHVTVRGGRENVLRAVRALEAIPYFAQMEEMGFGRATAGSAGPAGSAVQAIFTIRVSAL